jgi:hypothetical protein
MATNCIRRRTVAIEAETSELSVTANSMLYKIKGHPSKVYRFGGEFREYQLQEAAGDCAILVCGKVLGKPAIENGEIFFYGFMMDLANPIISTTLSPSQRRNIMHQMVDAVQRLHSKHHSWRYQTGEHASRQSRQTSAL